MPLGHYVFAGFAVWACFVESRTGGHPFRAVGISPLNFPGAKLAPADFSHCVAVAAERHDSAFISDFAPVTMLPDGVVEIVLLPQRGRPLLGLKEWDIRVPNTALQGNSRFPLRLIVAFTFHDFLCAQALPSAAVPELGR